MEFTFIILKVIKVNTYRYVHQVVKLFFQRGFPLHLRSRLLAKKSIKTWERFHHSCHLYQISLIELALVSTTQMVNPWNFIIYTLYILPFHYRTHHTDDNSITSVNDSNGISGVHEFPPESFSELLIMILASIIQNYDQNIMILTRRSNVCDVMTIKYECWIIKRIFDDQIIQMGEIILNGPRMIKTTVFFKYWELSGTCQMVNKGLHK